MKKIHALFLGMALVGLLAAVPAAAESAARMASDTAPPVAPAAQPALSTPDLAAQPASQAVLLAQIFLPQGETANECYCWYWDPMFCERRFGPNCYCNIDTCGCDCA